MDDNGNGEAAQAAAQQEPDEQSGGEAEQKAGQEPEPKPAQAPQEFDPTAIKVPDGVTADPALMQDFGKLVGEMNLSQDQAQALVDLQVKALQAQENQFVELRRNWVEEIKADPKYGGERLESTLQDATAVMRRFVSIHAPARGATCGSRAAGFMRLDVAANTWGWAWLMNFQARATPLTRIL